MEAVDILPLVDRGDHLVLVDMLGQGQLHQDSVDAFVGIQVGDDAEQLGLADRLRLADRRIADADFGRGLGLARHIGDAARVFAHEDYDQMRHASVFRAESSHFGGHFGLEFC